MLKTIIVTNKAKQIMYSKQSPPLKGVETAAAVSLQVLFYHNDLKNAIENQKLFSKHLKKGLTFRNVGYIIKSSQY